MKRNRNNIFQQSFPGWSPCTTNLASRALDYTRGSIRSSSFVSCNNDLNVAYFYIMGLLLMLEKKHELAFPLLSRIDGVASYHINDYKLSIVGQYTAIDDDKTCFGFTKFRGVDGIVKSIFV